MVRFGAVLGLVPVGDERAVGREGGHGARLVRLRQPPRLGALRVDVQLVQRLGEVDVPALAAHRGEDDAAAGGRPRRLVVLAVAVGELPLVAAVEAHDEEVPAAVAGPADVVELVVDAGEAPRRPALLVLLPVGVVADAPCEGDPLGVGRPRGRLDTLLALGQPARLAPVRRQHVQLAMRLLLLAVAVGDEREPAPVGRPAGRVVAPLAGRELPRIIGAVERRDPDRRAVAV